MDRSHVLRVSECGELVMSNATTIVHGVENWPLRRLGAFYGFLERLIIRPCVTQVFKGIFSCLMKGAAIATAAAPVMPSAP